MQKLIFSVFILLVTQVSAHSPDEAFFEVRSLGKFIEVKAELPWTIRTALFQYDTTLSKSSKKEKILKAFQKYTWDHLILRDAKGKAIKLSDLQELNNLQKHNHANEYRFLYEGTEVSEIINTFMFEIHPEQVNYMEVVQGDQSAKFVLTPSSPSKKIELKAIIHYELGLFIILPPILFLFYLRLVRRRKSENA